MKPSPFAQFPHLVPVPVDVPSLGAREVSALRDELRGRVQGQQLLPRLPQVELPVVFGGVARVGRVDLPGLAQQPFALPVKHAEPNKNTPRWRRR